MIYELQMKWGTSKGRDTYGYTTCTIFERGEKVASCMGGGYDMKGTAFGNWLAKRFQDRLMKLGAEKRFVTCVWNGKLDESSNYVRTQPERKVELYGGTYYPEGARDWEKKKARAPYVSLDGACGYESMVRIAEAIGLKVRLIDAGKSADVIIVEDMTDSPALLTAAPDMLAALKTSEHRITQLCEMINVLSGNSKKARPEDFADVARAAIAKAEGRGA